MDIRSVKEDLSTLMWGSLYLSVFLLRDGWLTLMNMATLMVLAMVCDLLSTMENCPVWYYDLRC